MCCASHPQKHPPPIIRHRHHVSHLLDLIIFLRSSSPLFNTTRGDHPPPSASSTFCASTLSAPLVLRVNTEMQYLRDLYTHQRKEEEDRRLARSFTHQVGVIKCRDHAPLPYLQSRGDRGWPLPHDSVQSRKQKQREFDR